MTVLCLETKTRFKMFSILMLSALIWTPSAKADLGTNSKSPRLSFSEEFGLPYGTAILQLDTGIQADKIGLFSKRGPCNSKIPFQLTTNTNPKGPILRTVFEVVNGASYCYQVTLRVGKEVFKSNLIQVFTGRSKSEPAKVESFVSETSSDERLKKQREKVESIPPSTVSQGRSKSEPAKVESFDPFSMSPDDDGEAPTGGNSHMIGD